MSVLLVLEDGSALPGRPYGAAGVAAGELVFTTAMTGYQEVVTDPSYAGQVVTFTQPMIGNYGVEAAVSESGHPHAQGVVVREGRNSTPCGREGFSDWLAGHGVVGIQGIDTRAITRRLRDGGSLGAALGDASERELLELARSLPGMSGQALAGGVSRHGPEMLPALGPERAHVVLVDYGIKGSIVRLVREAGARVTVLPWDVSAEAVLAQCPDAVLLGNGPGDPAALAGPVETVRALLGRLPVFGICLGHQLLALALGLRTYKLRFGHRGANHPVLDVEHGTVLVTAQNHGFSVEPAADGLLETAFGPARVTHRSLYDGTVEGLSVDGARAWSLQFHPEAGPGPHDARPALTHFVDVAAAAAGSRVVA